MSHNERMIEFGDAERMAGGYLVEPAGPDPYPAILVIHEWWGLTDHIKDIARRFSEQGYVVLAPDLYDGVVTRNPEEGGRLMQSLDTDRTITILNAGIEWLQSQPNVQQGKVGVTGFCMGGTFALLLACRNNGVLASVPFYGDIPSEADLERLSAPVLFIAGEGDAWINSEKVSRLKEGLQKYGKKGEVIVYPGAGHAFFNDTRPDAYNADAAQDAWLRVTGFFKGMLG